jgi:hypothetical protein
VDFEDLSHDADIQAAGKWKKLPTYGRHEDGQEGCAGGRNESS